MLYVLIAVVTYILYDLDKVYTEPQSSFYQLKTKESYIKSYFLKWTPTKWFRYSFIAIMILILFAGLRNLTVGIDMPNYYRNFINIMNSKNLFGGDSFEIFYQLLNFIPAIIFGQEWAFTITLLLCSSIIIFCANYVSKNLSPNVALTMFLFVSVDIYFSGFNQIRQAVAIAILMCALVCVIKKKPLLFVIFSILATGFHYSAIIFLPVYIFTKLKPSYLIYALLSAFAIILGLIYKPVIKILCDVFHLDYYNDYIVNSQNESLGLGITLKIIVVALLFLAFMVYYIYYFKKKKIENKKLKLYLDIYFCALVVYIFSAITMPVLMRFVDNFYWVIILIVPEILHNIKNTKIKGLLNIAVLIVGIACIVSKVCISNDYGIYPYESILF